MNGGPQEAKVVCQRCKQEFTTTLPPPELMNSRRVSLIAVVHEDPIVCSWCKAQYVYGIADGQLSFGWALHPLPDETASAGGPAGDGQSRIIVPPLERLRLMKDIKGKQ